MLPFKKGAFHLAVEAQVNPFINYKYVLIIKIKNFFLISKIPVVSVVISSYLDFFSHDEKKFLQGQLMLKHSVMVAPCDVKAFVTFEGPNINSDKTNGLLE